MDQSKKEPCIPRGHTKLFRESLPKPAGRGSGAFRRLVGGTTPCNALAQQPRLRTVGRMTGKASPSAANARSFVLIDDTATLRELLKDALLRRFAPCEVRDFVDGKDGLKSCLERAPDLLIVDLYLRDTDGREVIRELRRQGLQLKIIVLTAHPDASLPAELVGLGVAGFVDKNSPMEQIERAVQRVLDGGMFFSAAVPPPVPAIGSELELPRMGAEALSEREKEVVRLVARGFLSKEVADKLGLSTRTVEKHRSRILAKLGLRDVPSLVRWCLRNGLG